MNSVRQGHGSDFYAAVEASGVGQCVEAKCPKPADGAFFNRDQDFMLIRQAAEQFRIERFGKTGIRDRG